MVFQHLQDCCSLMRVTAINLTVQWSRRQQHRVLPELATLICNDTDPLVRSAAINVTAQFFTALDPDLKLQYIQALVEAICDDPDSRVRLAAINATGQLSTALDPDLQFQYNSLVLSALAKAIRDFKYPQVQEDAPSAVINISKNYPRDTLTPIVGTLLELHAFVEYETIELAEKAALELNKEGNWRNSLKVRLLRRPAKPAQARGKKAGQEDEAVHKEDDTSTSEQHTPNEKHLDDTQQQSEVQSHEHVGEDHSNEKEGGQKKGRNRGRGKGRGRPQYNHHNNHYNNHNNHNNRGAHVVTPPSSNSVNNEHPVIGKQPPGPRMPDGTRGFSMGRGKPISVAIEKSIS